MKSILFITGNEGKLREVRSLIPDIQSVEMDLTEIQEIDAHKIILAKLEEARKYYSSTALIVEDTSLYLHALSGLPGPLVKWFLGTIGVEGIYKLTEPFGSKRATARTFIGYADEDGIRFFEGSIAGIMVPPRGTDGFGWDSIFQPDGCEKTFAEMSQQEKSLCSMRKIAVEGLRQYLEQSDKVGTQ